MEEVVVDDGDAFCDGAVVAEAAACDDLGHRLSLQRRSSIPADNPKGYPHSY